jgi:ATP-binding cassette subfamily B (MDR/TAP) protein 1
LWTAPVDSIRQWKLALVVSTVIPITVLAVGVTVLIDVRMDRKVQKVLEAASNIARDALANIRDIAASTAETSIFRQYDQLLLKAIEYGKKQAPAIGLQLSFEVFFVCCGYSLSFWYGTLLFSREEASIGSILT